MLRSCLNARSLLVGVHGAIGVAVLGVLTAFPRDLAAQSPEKIPQFVTEAAGTSLSDFAYALTEAGLSAGFVAPDTDVIAGPLKVWHSVALNRTEVQRDTVLGAFRARHPAYETAEQQGVLQVRAREVVAGALVRARTNRFQLDRVPLGTAFQEAMRIVNPAFPVRDGGVASHIVGPGEHSRAPAHPVVSVDLSNASLFDALNEIVRRAPGTVWLLTERGKSQGQPAFYTLAYLTPGGYMTEFQNQLR